MSLPASFFDDFYRGRDDPWGFTDRWYEERKRALTLAALPDADLGRAFEPGCSLGVLSAELAPRCSSLLATDISAGVVASARDRLRSLDHVTVEVRAVPADWPAEPFDLVVLSELAYYLAGEDLHELAERAAHALTPTGTLLACHWRHPVADYPTSGDAAHAALGRAAEEAGLTRLARHEEVDLLLEVWSPDPRGVGARTGLVP